MSKSTGVLEIKYTIETGKAEFGGNLKKNARKELIEAFLTGQIGAGEDKTPPEERETYSIRLEWFPEDDRIEVGSNTGNKGLRDGILLQILKNM